LHPVCYDTVCFALLTVVSCYQEKFVKQLILDNQIFKAVT